MPISTSTRLPSGVSNPCFIRARCGMMSKSPFLEVGNLVLALADDDFDDGLFHPAAPWPRSLRLRVFGGLVVAQRRITPSTRTRPASFACQRGMIRWYMRAQVILSMHTSMDLPDSQRVAQCSTKSAAILSRRSSAVMTS